MPKPAPLGYFHPAPPHVEAQACLDEIRLAATVLRKPQRISKLEAYIPVIAHYTKDTDASLQEICAVLKFRHKLQVNKSTLFRFIQTNQKLAALRALHPTSPPANGRQP